MLAVKVIATVLLWLVAAKALKLVAIEAEKQSSPYETAGLWIAVSLLYGFFTYAVWC